MFIILEGNEGTGKTTLAEKFSNMLGVEITHRSAPKNEDERQAMYRSYLDDINNLEHAIWDRCFYSEMVYGPIMRDQSYINVEQMREYEKLLAKKGAIVIYCHGDPHICFRRAQQRGESYIVDFSTYETIDIAYKTLFKSISHEIPILEFSF